MADLAGRVLLMLDGWEIDPDDPITLPPAIAGGGGLDLIHRIQDALYWTQHQTSPRYGRLLAPEANLRGRHDGPGRYEHVPLTLATFAAADIEALNVLAQTLGHPGLDPDIVTAIA